MPSLSQQQQGATRTVAPPDTSMAPAGNASRGNAFLQDQLRSKQGLGKLTWKAALGDALGGKLYDALAPQLTDDKLLGHARSAVDSAVASLKGQLQGQVQPSDQEAADLFMAEIDKALRSIAQDAVVNSGLSQGIRDFADAHPYEIALAAAAGAVAYVLSNQDLPLLEAKLGLGGGHSLVGGIDPGRTMSLALEQVRVGYRYQGDHVAGFLDADKFKDGYSVDGGVKYSPSAGTDLGLTGSHSDRDGTQRSKLDLSYRDPGMGANLGFERDVTESRSRDSVTAGISTTPAPGALDRHASATWRSDGSWEAAAGVSKTDRDSSWSVEGFAGRDAAGNQDAGIRALYKLRF
jgi:hypothetical protein